MSKKYNLVPNEKREQVIDMVHEQGLTIKEAA